MQDSNNTDRYYLGKSEVEPDVIFQFGLSIDCVVFGYHEERLKVLLIERGMEPFKDYWALPGDLVSPEVALRDAANDILSKLTGLDDIYMEQFRTFGSVDRHPAGRVITVGYYSLVRSRNHNPVASSWANQTDWIDIEKLPPLAFDHQNILEKGIETLKKKVRTEPIGFELLPAKFTLLELQQLYEAFLGYKMDKPNFRKKILGMDLLIPLNEVQTNVAHRPAKLFRFDIKRYEQLKEKGFNFEI